MSENKKYHVLGLMSGTSLDGIDLAVCTFYKTDRWEFKINKHQTINYPKSWKNTLKNLHTKNKETIKKVDFEYGLFLGKIINTFLSNNKVDYIASHGHTIFHQPENNYTLQIGDGAAIAKATNITTINNFRSLDVSLNGQGAPLVPIGDLHLFPQYKYCINLGGFANISIKNKQTITAFDICPVNIVLNKLCSKLSLEYDNKGEIARSGKLIPELLKRLNKLNFYSNPAPKSLGREWVEKNITPLIEMPHPTADLLHTFCEHIAQKIGKLLINDTALITGGGAYNSFLVERIKHYASAQIIIPNPTIIDFKEALLFGFLGVLRLRNEPNCLQSVTGAKRDNCGGEIYQPII